jgi:hypothetical protein
MACKTEKGVFVNERNDFVGVLVAGLDVKAASAIIEQALAEAHRLLVTRARMRRFQLPLIYRSFDSAGRLMMKHDNESDWQWSGRERGERNAIVIEDARGRKAFVRIEVCKVAF